MKARVCFVITKSEIGGAQKWVKEQIDILSEQYDIYLITNKIGWLTNNVNICDTLIDSSLEKRFSIKYFFKLYTYLSEKNIHLLVCNSANAGLYGRLIKLFFRVKVIYVSHGWSAIYNGGRLKKIYKCVELLLSFLTDSVLCISESDYKRAKEDIKINYYKLFLCPNRIKPIVCDQQIQTRRKFNLLTVARCNYPKRLDLLIKSVSDLECNLYIVGDGLQKEKLVNFCKEKKIKNVCFLGEIQGFKSFSSFNAFILISDSEGLPLSALEAMSCGLPLILSNVGGCPELIEKNGVLVDNSEQSIAFAINEVIKNHTEFAINSKRLFDNKYNLDKYFEEYLKYYASVLAK